MIKETSKMKTAKKLVVLMVVLAMVFALNVPAFAASSQNGTIDVVFLIKSSYTSSVDGTTYNVTIPTGYSASTAFPGYHEYRLTNKQVSAIPFCPVYTHSTLNVFDVFYYTAVTFKGESVADKANTQVAPYADFVYGGNASNGYYIDKLSGVSTNTVSDPSATNYWAGLSWAMYEVPEGITYDVTNPVYNPATYSNDYMLSSYASNTAVTAGSTYYMVYQFDEYTW